MSYHVDVHPRVVHALGRLPASERARVALAIAALADVPRPPGSKKLRGQVEWRLRVGAYRIIYNIFDRQQIVAVHQLKRRTTHTYD